MNDSFRRLLGLAAVAGACACTIGPAGAQWGYGAPTTYGTAYYGSTTYGSNALYAPTYGTTAPAPAYDANSYPSRYSFHGPGYGLGGYPAYVNAPYHLEQSPYGYTQPYGYGIYSRRGRVDWDNWSPFGDREIEYSWRRNGTLEIDIDD